MKIEHFREDKTPVSQPIRGRESEMAQNHAGGYGFDQGPEGVVYRFANLGIDGGTYYRSERKLFDDTVEALRALAGSNPGRLLEIVLEARDQAMRQRDPIAAYAVGTSFMPHDARALAYDRFNQVIRTGSDLLYFMALVRRLRGIGKGLRWAIARWYASRPDLEFQVAKYRNRWGFTHADVLRLAHPRPETPAMERTFAWLIRGEVPEDGPLRVLHEVNRAESLDKVIELVERFRLSWEMVPTRWFRETDFWRAMMPGLPDLAFLRHLHRFLLDRTLERMALERIAAMTAEPRVHPGRVFDAIVALADRGVLDQALARALRDLTMSALGADKKASDIQLGIAIDTSGSMMYGINPNARKALAIAALLATRFPGSSLHPFSNWAYRWPSGLLPEDLAFLPSEELSDTIELKLNVGGTNVASGVKAAAATKPDAVVVITDEQTWLGDHASTIVGDRPFIAITFGRGGVSLTDPKNPKQVTVVGWVPEIADFVDRFVRGEGGDR